MKHPSFLTSKQKMSVLGASILCSVFFASTASAATLLMSPSSSHVKVNNLFTVKILVNTQGKAVNNIESSLNFPNDLVEVVSVDSKSSLFTLWVEQPHFSNSSGVVSFNGGITNPGFTGSGGTLLSVVLKAKKEGVASLFFSGAAIRENDGLGTDILSGQNSADIVIGDPQKQEPPETKTEPPKEEVKKEETTKKEEKKVSEEETFLGLSVSSPSHPSSDMWYQLKNAIFVWNNTKSINTLQVGLSRQPGSIPTKNIAVDSEKREVNDIDDGISYFNIRYKNDTGWSEVSSYKLQIDSEPPYDLSLVAKSEENGGIKLLYNAQDDSSGIQSFELKVDKGEAFALPLSKENGFVLPLTLGKHDLELLVKDKAGNQSSYTTTVTVAATQAPTITFYSPQVKFKEDIYIRGQSSYAKANVSLTVRSPHGVVQNYDVNTDETGKFAFSSEPASLAGEYEIWASVLNSDGTKGPVSERVKVIVLEKVSFFRFLGRTFLSIPVLLSLWILTGISSAIGWYLCFKYKRQLLHHRGKLKEKEDKK